MSKKTNNNVLETKEQTRFSLLNGLVSSEVIIGRTLFSVSSQVSNEKQSFKEVIRKLAENQLNKTNTDTDE